MARILVIDDAPAMLRVIAKTLETGGHEPIAAGDGRSGLELLAAHGPAVVITDLLMPDMDGIETIREIRVRAPETKILAVSGGGQAGRLELLDVASSFGADMVLTKPFRAEALLAAVQELLA